MQDFTKEQIAQTLALIDLPMSCAFELRKLRMGDTTNPESYTHILAMYHQLTVDLFDPPYPYLGSSSPIPNNDWEIDRLSYKDNSLLHDIFKIENLDALLESADKFKEYCKLFTESEKKPDWDLVRVLASDTWSNYLERQIIYESLLNGGLTARINSKKINQLDEDVYRLSKRFTTASFDKDDRKGLMTYHFSACSYYMIGYKLSEYLYKLNEGRVSELEKKQYASQINDILRDALMRGDLPVHRKPSFSIVKYTVYSPPPSSDVLFWHEIKPILVAAGCGMPDEPVFMEEYSKIVKQQTETIGDASADGQSDTESASTEVVQGNTEPKDGKDDQNKRQSQLYVFIWRVHQVLSEEKKPTAQELWRNIQKNHAEYDTDKIIQEVDGEQILWCSGYNNEQKLLRTSFDKTLSNIRKNPPN